MKKIFCSITVILLAALVLVACNNKTPQQKASEKFEKEQQMRTQEAMKHEIYIDSIVNIAEGLGKYQFLTENRLNALEILRNEYPEMKDKWDELEIKIKNQE